MRRHKAVRLLYCAFVAHGYALSRSVLRSTAVHHPHCAPEALLLRAINSDTGDTYYNDDNDSAHRVYLHVPYAEKEEAKMFGARWDPLRRRWYCSKYQPMQELQRWQMVHLQVPFDEKEDAKQLGAQWDSQCRQWFIPAALLQGERASRIQKWIPVDQRQVGNAKTGALLILKVETNGLPQLLGSSIYPPFTDLASYSTSRVVTINCLLVNSSSFDIISSERILIRAEDFDIENTQFHGVTVQQSLSEGVPFPEAAARVQSYLQQAEVVVAHNAEFDISILSSEAHRHHNEELLRCLQQVPVYCTMHGTKSLLQLVDRNGSLKNPSLRELCAFAADNTGTELQQEEALIKPQVEDLRIALQSLCSRGMLHFQNCKSDL